MNVLRLLQKLGLYKEPANYCYRVDKNNIEILNFWATQLPQEFWVYQFINYHFRQYLTAESSVLLSSVFGPRKAIEASLSKRKIFYTGENLNRFHEYRDHCFNTVDLSIGFDYLDRKDYVRFPIWIFYFFGVDAELGQISRLLKQFIVQTDIAGNDKKFCSLVCSHDGNGIRKKIVDCLNPIGRVDSGGTFMNNTQDLRIRYDNDKKLFISKYKFNICTENTNRVGYVTEKLFEAIKSDTIPIYWGSNGRPEPDVLSQDAILFFNDKKQLGKQVEELMSNERLYRAFKNQPKFVPTAAEYIADRFSDLRNKMQQILVY